jgi:hypothetical protein
MKQRLQLLAAATIAGVTAGATLSEALRDANQAQARPFTHMEWSHVGREAVTRGRQPLFVVVQVGTPVPSVTSKRILGDCEIDGECSIPWAGTGAVYRWVRSPLVAGARLYMIDTGSYFAVGWRQAAAESAGATGPLDGAIRFWEGMLEAPAHCLADPDFTPAQCSAMFRGVNDCWLQGDGITRCRHGLEYKPGQGGVLPNGDLATCSPTGTSKMVYCTDRGKGQAWAKTAHLKPFPTDEELDPQ